MSNAKTQDAVSNRTEAQRITIPELKQSLIELKEKEENVDDNTHPTKYQLLPTGHLVNRVVLMGAVLECEQTGSGSYRTRIATQTDGITVWVNSDYSPKVASKLADIEPPEHIMLVGKPSTYENSDGEDQFVIRPEELTVVDEETRNKWVLETANRTLERIEENRDGETTFDDIAQGYNYDLNKLEQQIKELGQGIVNEVS